MAIQRHSHSGRGGDGEKINYENLINKPDVPAQFIPQAFTAHVLKTNGEGSGDVKVVTGFKPKYVTIASIYQTGITRRREESTSWTVSDSLGNLTTTTEYKELDGTIYQTFGSGPSNTIPCVYIRRDTPRTQQLFMKSFDEDGFTMNYGINGTNDVGMHILALG